MTTRKKYTVQKEHPYPHMGKLLQDCIKEKRITQAQVARSMEVHPIVVTRYLRNQSLQAGILWKAGLALRQNFFADIAQVFPYDRWSETEIAELRDRVRTLEKEVMIYKDLLTR